MNSMLLPYCRLARAKSPAVPKSLAPIIAAAVPAVTVPVVPVMAMVGTINVPKGWGAGTDKTMPKQIKAKQKITTGFIWNCKKKTRQSLFTFLLSSADLPSI